MNDTFEIVSAAIAGRRTIKPAQMNGRIIPDELIHQLLALANWAPTHGNTEPWRFFVWAGREKTDEFCRQHAALYRQHTPPQSYNEGAVDKLTNMGNNASHVIIAAMRRGTLERIPVLEEIAAAAAAVENLLIGASAAGIAAYWGSGGMVLKPAMNDFLDLREEDLVLGALYLGYSDVVKKGSRVTPAEMKVSWM